MQQRLSEPERTGEQADEKNGEGDRTLEAYPLSTGEHLNLRVNDTTSNGDAD